MTRACRDWLCSQRVSAQFVSLYFVLCISCGLVYRDFRLKQQLESTSLPKSPGSNDVETGRDLASVHVDVVLPTAETNSPLAAELAQTTLLPVLHTTKSIQSHISIGKVNHGGIVRKDTSTNIAPLFPRSSRKTRSWQAMPDLFDFIFNKNESSFIETIRNPCWYGKHLVSDGKGPELEPDQSLLCMPHFYLIGHVKSGTSDLWDTISRHPHVNPGRVLKEQHYFSRSWHSAPQWIAKYKRFAASVESKPERESIAGDATPDYIWANLRYLNNEFRGSYKDSSGRRIANNSVSKNVTIAEVVAELNPDARLLLSLRSPTNRLWSDFFYFAHRPNTERDFDLVHPDTKVTAEDFDTFARMGVEAFTGCLQQGGSVHSCSHSMKTFRHYHAGRVRFAMGCYGGFVQEWLAQFQPSQLLVTSLEEYKLYPQDVVRSVFQHLGVHEPTTAEWTAIMGKKKVVNQQSEHYQTLTMLNSTRQLLNEAYTPCIRLLDEVLDSNGHFEKLWLGTS
eukprot:m.39188 g.39188  ORF g.39188 m.39188 type:complete len:507 (+) comp18117_c0_seq1:125-1645(+)